MGQNQCDSTKGLSCNNSRCQCDYSTQYWNINFQTCSKEISFILVSKIQNISFFECLAQRVNYTDQCVHDSDCIPTLVCPRIPGVCNCSQFLPDLVCNCDNTKYYDPASMQCCMKRNPSFF